MLTIEKLNIYKKYSGDIDLWARLRKKNEISLMNDNDWKLIDDLIQSLELIKKNVASENFKFQTFERIQAVCEDEETQNSLKSLGEKHNFNSF